MNVRASRSKYVRWADKEDDILRALYDAGCDTDEMIEVFPGLNERQIRNRLRTLGLSLSRRDLVIDNEAFTRILSLRGKEVPSV